MLPREGEWTAALRRAAGQRARHRKARLEAKQIAPAQKDRKAVLQKLLRK